MVAQVLLALLSQMVLLVLDFRAFEGCNQLVTITNSCKCNICGKVGLCKYSMVHQIDLDGLIYVGKVAYKYKK